MIKIDIFIFVSESHTFIQAYDLNSLIVTSVK
jgi:hypothetical protein